MASFVLDSSRTTERLNAFLTEYVNSKPTDIYFNRDEAFDRLMKKKKTDEMGRQLWILLDQDKNNTITPIDDYETISTVRQDTVRGVGYTVVQYAGSSTISDVELREIAGKDHKLFDIMQKERDNLIASAKEEWAIDMFAATQAADRITTLATAVDSTGSCGTLSASTVSNWASVETASGSFATQGLSDMLTTSGTLYDRKANTDVIITDLATYNIIHKEFDPDIRYAYTEDLKGGRGFRGLKWMGSDIIHDRHCTAGVMYFLDTDHIYFLMDSAANFKMFPYERPVDQFAQTALFMTRGQLVIDNRKKQGKMTGVTA